MKPKIGMLYTVYGIQCRIVVIHKYGTIDVTSLDGKKSWRVSGLPF